MVLRAKMDERDDLVAEISEALRDLAGFNRLSAPDETTAGGRGHTQPDALIYAEVQGKPVIIVIAAKAHGYPRDMRAATEQLAHYVAHARPDSGDAAIVPMVVAPAISPGGRAVLRERGVAYWDRGGSLYLNLPGALYDIERRPPKAEERHRRSLYRGRAAQVVHTLLNEPERAWHVGELAATADVSAYTAHQVLTALERELWVDKAGRGPQAVRLLREPGALLDAWAAAHRLDDYAFRRFHTWAQSPATLRRQIAAALDGAGIEYALTLAAGAELVAPFATDGGRLALLVSARADLAEVIRGVGLRPAEEGDNVAFLLARDRSPLLFRRRVGDAWVASDAQLYRDLWAWPRRGREQAAHLRAERLPF
jgi:hypothetical protein